MANQLSIKDLLGANGDGASSWNWRESFVQLDENMATPGLFIASESTLIAFGPASATAAFDVVKVGLTPNISISQQIPQQRLPEIGSVRVHILNGVPIGGGTISRLVYNGPSLMRYAYGNLYDDQGNPTALALQGMATGAGPAQDFTTNLFKRIMLKPDKIMQGNKDTQLWLSAWDTRLRTPFGICMYFQDIAGNAVGGVYAEGAKINSHNMSQSAGQLIMVEGITFAFDRLVPVRGIGNSQL
jgi:hypothetical protein